MISYMVSKGKEMLNSYTTITTLTLFPTPLAAISLPLASEKHMKADLAGIGRAVVDAEEDSDDPLLLVPMPGASLK